MIFKRKGNEIYCFDNENDLKEYCSETANVNIKMFQDFDIQRFNKRTKRFDKLKSNKL